MNLSRSTILLRNIASNWVGFAVNAAVSLLLTPYVLHELGVARYGLWVLTSSVIGYYGILDLGFRIGVTQYMTRYLALRDYEKASDCISSAVLGLSALGAVMIALSFLTAFLAPHLLSLPADLLQEAFWCLLIVGFSGAVQCIFSSYASLFTSLQRFDLSNLIGITTRLFSAVCIVAALEMGQGLIGVSLAFFTTTVLDYLIRWQVALRLAPELEVRWKRAKLARLSEIAKFSAWNFLSSVNGYIYLYLPNLLISAFMPIAAVGHYALVTMLSRQVNSVLSPIAQVVFPAATELHVQDDISGLVHLYHHGSRLMILVMIPLVLGAAFWAEDFYRLWIGNSYLSGSEFHSVALLFRILLISTVTNFSTNVAQQILIGAGKVRIVAIALIIGSAINIFFSMVLIRPFGLAGIAMATVIASVVIDLIATPVMLQHVLGLTVGAFLRNSCIRPLAAGLMQGTLMILIRLLGPAADFIQLALQGLIAGSGSLVILVLIGLTKEDRQRFLIQPWSCIRKRRMTVKAEQT